MDSTRETRLRRKTRNIAPLYEKHAGPLKRYVRARVDSVDEAEDIVQDVFVEVCRGDIVGKANVNTEVYLLGVARHIIARHLRRKKSERQARRAKSHSSFQARTQPRTSDVDVERITMLLERLSPSAREALRLRFLEGLTPKEAAVHLGCSLQSFQSRLYRAVKTFEKLAPESERIRLRRDTR